MVLIMDMVVEKEMVVVVEDIFGGNTGTVTGADTNCGGAGGSGYINTSKLSSASTIAGNVAFPNTSGTGNETGHNGNGYAKISWISK